MPLTYQLITDTTCDLPASYYEDHNVEAVSLSFEVNGMQYSANDMSDKDFYDQMRNGAMTKTSQCTPETFETVFSKYLEKGLDVIYLAFSSGLSGTFNSANIAKESLLEKYPDRKIVLVDSLCASLGEGLLLDYAVKKRDEGVTVEELGEYIESIRPNLCQVFTVDDLKYLFRGGRVSRTAAIAGTLLGIKPVLHVDNEGHLVPIAKVRGRKASLNTLIDEMAKKSKGFTNKTIAISHGDCLADAQYVANQIKDKFGYDTCIINYVGKVIGSHSGPGTLALFFMGSER